MRIPSATYRLQFHSEFTFQDAVAILDYLEELGITDIYASPYFQASLGSSHGYDVVDHNTLNSEVGDTSEYRKFIVELHRRKMGQLLDFVPNHMGISESLNRWWADVLENGLASEYATYFDIDWHPSKQALSEKVLLPLLQDRYGKVLENAELILECKNGKFFIRYHSTKLPINPRTIPIILRSTFPYLPADHLVQIQKIITQLASSPEAVSAAKSQLEELITQNPQVQRAVDLAVKEFQGIPGDAETFDALHELLEQQSYRLSYWRLAAEEINYRRFFDVNHLAAIRVEIPEVFEASHHLLMRLLANGDVSGLRLDHIDGLWDPKQYLIRLQDSYAKVMHQRKEACPLYIVAEKILETPYESIPSDWPIAGTTGYEFAGQTTHLLVDAAAAKHFTKIYQQLTGNSTSFSDLVYQKKRLVIETSFQSEISALGRELDKLSEFYRNYRDFTCNLLISIVREVIACFPVYRTYATASHPPSQSEEWLILRAISSARRRNPTIDKAAFDFLRDLLLMHFPDWLTPALRQEHVHFVMKFQQCTSPVAAKGLEDTALYLYNRLIAFNEVGGSPGNFGLNISDFHQLNKARFMKTPHTLLGTSTHDTKRSEDVRLRIAALSEIPSRWKKSVQQWMRMNQKLRVSIEGETAPSRNEEYFLYQSLVGTWPLDLSPENQTDFTTRIQQYLIKALKEGKVNSSWTEPNDEWEQAVAQFIAKILDPKLSGKFLTAFTSLAEEIALLGAWNSLTETILKCTLPGVPDFYQGTEIWDFSLVDPDNRRPVDYSLRKQMLQSLPSASPEELISDWKSGRIKMFLIQRLLQFRRKHADFFCQAEYQPLAICGEKENNAIAFLRKRQGAMLLVLVPRLTSQLGEVPTGKVWGDTHLESEFLSGSWYDVLTKETHHFEQQRQKEELLLSQILARFPFAVLYRSGSQSTEADGQ